MAGGIFHWVGAASLATGCSALACITHQHPERQQCPRAAPSCAAQILGIAQKRLRLKHSHLIPRGTGFNLQIHPTAAHLRLTQKAVCMGWLHAAPVPGQGMCLCPIKLPAGIVTESRPAGDAQEETMRSKRCLRERRWA